MINITEENFKRKTNLVKRSMVVASGILLLISLTQNAYYIEGMRESIGSFGLIAFFLGWLMIFNSIGIVWLANPLLFLSWFLLFTKHYRKAIIPSGLAVLSSLSFLFFKSIVANEGGGESQIISYDIGYWLWISSFITDLLGNFILLSLSRNNH